MRAQQVDVIISNWNELFEVFAAARLKIPHDVAFASLDVPTTGMSHVAGVVQNHQLVGQRAMEQLALIAEAGQRGVPEVQTISCIPGYWQDGTTAPAKKLCRSVRVRA